MFLTSFIFQDFFLYFLSINIVFNVYNEPVYNITFCVIHHTKHNNIFAKMNVYASFSPYPLSYLFPKLVNLVTVEEKML